MSLTTRLARRSADLWADFTARSLDDIAHANGTTHRSQLWLTQRSQRDRLLEAAALLGCRGWLNPPIQFLSSLPELFEIKGKPIGLLARRHLLAELAGRHARANGLPVHAADAAPDAAVVRSHMLDALFGELLPEDVSAEALERNLSSLAVDDFAARRNAWIVAVYRDYSAALERLGTYDARQIHALAARRIDAGNLRSALGGAERLHIFGLHSTRSRRCLLRSLAQQQDVDVTVYTTGDAAEWSALTGRIELIEGTSAVPVVQPAPDTHSELQWVAGQVKQLLLAGAAEPHEIAVVARTGLEDTRRALRALESAGIPATARVRTPLSEIAALKAVLDLFRGAAESWSYRALRTVLASPYFGFRIDLRPFDRIASDARPSSLQDWHDELQRLQRSVIAGEDSDAQRMGIFADRLARDVTRFEHVQAIFARLDGPKRLGDWLELSHEILCKNWFRIRRRICQAPAGRQDIVRLDQRGVHQLEALLDEWTKLGGLEDLLTPEAWYRVLRALLENQELVLTTPGQKGVQVLEAHDAVAAHFRATFLVHANDGEFPRAGMLAGMFTEEERTDLRTNGLPIDDRESVQARERALWNSVVGSGEQTFISYRTTDARGTPLLASLLVSSHGRAGELPRSTEVLGDPLNPEQARRRDAALLGERLRAGAGVSAWTSVEPDALRHALLNAHAEQMRGAPDRLQLAQALSPWNGQLNDPWVLARLSEKFGPEYSWSASQLQLYAESPFFFLLDRVLRLEAVEEAEEETSPLAFGGIAHDVLQRFYDEVKSALPGAMNDATAVRLRQAAEAVFAARESAREWLGSPVIWKQKKRQIQDVLHDFVTWELLQLAKKRETPRFCERELGVAQPLDLVGTDARGQLVTMRVTGRVDRVDEDRNHGYLVVDYKTSYTPSSGFEDGAILQGPLYMEALRQEKNALQVTRALYRSLKKLKNGGEVKFGDEKWRQALRAAFSIPARVRAGLFEVQLAASKEKWASYRPGLDVRRSNASVPEGTRFDA